MHMLPSDLVTFLSRMDRIAVCFSGGIDSTFLLAASHEVLGDRVLALTARSATFTREEMEASSRFCREQGIPHLLLDTHEMDDPHFVSNPLDRCYHCKKHRLSLMIRAAASHGFEIVADGENLDDSSDVRPGRQAAEEQGVSHPLAKCGLTKEMIRRISRKMGLSNWNQPSNSCLATRIPYGRPITRPNLEQIRICESFLRGMGISPIIRVRHLGTTARIEVAPADLHRLSNPHNWNDIVDFFAQNHFHSVVIDPRGYHTGRAPSDPPILEARNHEPA